MILWRRQLREAKRQRMAAEAKAESVRKTGDYVRGLHGTLVRKKIENGFGQDIDLAIGGRGLG